MRTKFNIVIVLGAGASYEAGAPLMNGFFDKARLLYSSQQLDKDVIVDFKRVFDAINALQSVHSKAFIDIYNLEAVFAAFEFAQLLQINETFNHDLIVSLKKLIAVTIEKSLKFKLTNAAYGLEPPAEYLEFVKLIKEWRQLGCRVTVISFNYDIALDYAFLRVGIPINYCLNDYAPKADELVFLKLHGSLHWNQCNVCQRIFAVDLSKSYTHPSNLYPTKTLVEMGLRKIQIEHLGLDNKTTCAGQIDSVCYLVPPSWNKYSYYQTIAPIWRQAAKELKNANSISVCGYSLPLTDQFFHNLYALGTMDGEPLHSFHVYNPDSSDVVQNRFKDLLGTGAVQKFRYISGEPGRFSQSMQTIHYSLKALLR